MVYDMLLLRFGEITIKGRNRSKFEKAAYRHVKEVLKPFPNVKVIKEYGRLYVELNGEPIEPLVKVLRHVFGIVSLSPVKKAPSELEPIIETALTMMREIDPQPNTKFKVTGRRAWKQFPHSSQELNHLVGAPLLREFQQLSVDVRNPELTVRVEVREEGTYIFSQVIPAAGGFPLGTNGKAMLLLSGGIDSPVAGYQAMRRGLEIEAVHFHSYPFTSERAQQKVLDLAQVLANYSGRIKVHMVPFTDLQTRLHQANAENLLITMMRRAFLRITTKLADKHKALAIVTGDSLGQVASQTLGSMNAIGRVTDIPLLRPLVTVDKEEIVRIAQEIGTFETSILPFEDCCTLFVPKSPATNPNLKILERVESSIPEMDDLIEKAVEDTQTVVLYAQREGAVAVNPSEVDKEHDSLELDADAGITESASQPTIDSKPNGQPIGDWF